MLYLSKELCGSTDESAPPNSAQVADTLLPTCHAPALPRKPTKTHIVGAAKRSTRLGCRLA